LNNQRLVKISDFEASCVVKNDNKMITGQIGTPFYTAPEIWEEEPYNYKCDIWSIGCIIYEMASLTLPFKGDTIASLYKNIMSKKIKPIPDFYSEDLKKIINHMLIFDPSERPSTDLLLNYPRIKEESAKLKDIYEKYKINKNSRNIQNKDNFLNVKESSSDSLPYNILVNRNSFTNLKIPLKGKSQFNEPLKNQNLSTKTRYSEKTANFIKRDINDLYKNKPKKVIKNSKYRTLKERKEPNLVENRQKGSRSHSKKKGTFNNYNDLNNISTLRIRVPNLNKINEKIGLKII
jgi:NIMA (never in mitosis gene a)-related kinase